MAHVKTPRSAGVKIGLTRDAVLDAALELVDAEGIDRLSMRRLALVLDVEAQSIYNHVENKQDLIDGVVDVVLGAAIGLPDAPWDERLAEHARRIRGCFVAHPRAYDLVLQASTRSVALRQTTAQLLAVLESAGVHGWRQRQAFVLVTSVLDGFVIGERYRARMDTVPTDVGDEFAALPDFLTALAADGDDSHFDALVLRLQEAVGDLAEA